MAVNPRDIPITREQMHGWLQEYESLEVKPDKREFLISKLGDHATTLVNTSQRDDYSADQVELIDMVMDDLESYG
jgi:hypothetical protein